MVRRAASALVVVAVVVACGGSGAGGASGGDCSPATALCKKAESCSNLREPKVKTTHAGDGGAATLTWKSVDDCVAAYVSQACDAAVDRVACQSAIDGATCAGDAVVVPSVCLKPKS